MVEQCALDRREEGNGTVLLQLTLPAQAVKESTTVSCFSGDTGSTVNLTLSRAPYFTVTPPANITIAAGSNQTLECRATGDEPLSLSWRRGNSLISFGPHLHLVGLALGDEGDYSCLANSSAGSSQTDTRITITAPAAILEGPGQLSALEWSPVVLSCLVSGRPLPSVSWLVGGAQQGEQSDIVNADTISSTLSLEGLPPGTYSLSCKASNAVGPAKSSNGTLIVQPVVPSLRYQGALKEGSALRLVCSSEVGGAVFSWLKDGSSLNIVNSEYGIVDQDSSSQLSVGAAVPGVHDGLYTCRLDSHLVNGTRPTTNIVIVITNIDDCVSGPCANQGSCWDLVGGFTCECSPGWDGQSCEQPATGGEPPTITQSPGDHRDSPLLGEVVLTCEASGSPRLFTWHKEGVEVGNSSTGQLVLKAITPAERGLYTCRAQNSAGLSSPSSAGLLTIRGVLQYLVNITACTGLEEILLTMQELFVGTVLSGSNATVYSAQRRPGGAPDQLVLTVVAPAHYRVEQSSEHLQNTLLDEIKRIVTHCQFPYIRRYDGCPYEEAAGVHWPELPLYSEAVRPCPCGSLELTQTLVRLCSGSFRFGGLWNVVDTESCGFSPVSPQLCQISLVRVEDQVGLLEEATERVSLFQPLDITIASLLLEKITVTSLEPLLWAGVVQSYSNLLAANRTLVETSQLTSNSASRLLTGLDKFGLSIDSVQLSGSRLELTVDNSSSYSVNSSGQLTGASISLPPQVLEESVAAGGVVYYALTSDSLFVYDELPEGNSPILGDLFVSATVGVAVRDLPEPVVLRFRLDQEIMNSVSGALCVFWNESQTNGFGEWSTEGCALNGINSDGAIECHCTHLTHFSVILSLGPTSTNQVLSTVTYVGTALSLLCLLLTLLTYLLSPRLRAKPIGRLVINMCLPLAGFYAFFLVGIQGEYFTEWLCYLVTSLTHYCLLVYLLWTSVDALHIYYKLVKVLDSHIRHFLLKGGLVAWGLPLLITGVATGLGVHYQQWDSGTSPRFCYPRGLTLGLALILPFCLVFLLNLVLFSVILVSLCLRLRRIHQLQRPTISSAREVRRLLLIAVILWTLFGLGWVFGLLVSVSAAGSMAGLTASEVFQYIFTVCVGLQGVAIFILHCLRSPEVRAEWKRLLTCSRGTKPRGEVTSSSPPISPTDRISKNPVYISTEQLSYGPLPPSRLPVTPVKHSTEMVEPTIEAQILELEFADSASDSVGGGDLTDITTVPFCEGELGTAIGPRLSLNEHTML